MYHVLSATETTVAVWDGISFDRHREPAGVMTMTVGQDHGFKAGDRVVLTIKKKEEQG